MVKNKKFYEEISNRLNVVAGEIADAVVKDIFAKIEKNADDPMVWPLSIEDEIKPIVDCQRAINIMIDRLNDCGIAYMNGSDYTVIDISDQKHDDVNYDDVVERDVQDEIMTSKRAVDMTVSNEANRLSDVYSSVAQKIESATYSGDYSIVIPTSVAPIMGKPNVIKRLVKKLIANGYHVSADNKKIDVGARPSYTKMKKITVQWGDKQ